MLQQNRKMNISFLSSEQQHPDDTRRHVLQTERHELRPHGAGGHSPGRQPHQPQQHSTGLCVFATYSCWRSYLNTHTQFYRHTSKPLRVSNFFNFGWSKHSYEWLSYTRGFRHTHTETETQTEHTHTHTMCNKHTLYMFKC